ncbi:MAG: superoxide dismutase [Chthoniobacterales bacterium]|nr:superoxide dismutase [Chthoniobacterales bacterium]
MNTSHSSHTLKRRDFLRLGAVGSAVMLSGGFLGKAFGAASSSHAAAADQSSGPFTLPPLPYAYDALEPHIDTETMRIHHDKHHAAYVNNANKALAAHPDLAKMTVWELVAHLDEVPDDIRTTLRNNAGGHANHSLFWLMMKPGGGGKPTGDLATAIDETFGSFDEFKTQFTAAAMKVFGSGWAWLSFTPDKELVIETTANQDSPLMNGGQPILGVDVWEHAYYLKNQNRRADYVEAWWNVVDWDYAAKRYDEATKK